MAGRIELDPKKLESVLSGALDIGHVVSLLPGVVGSRGFSNSYSVRGGNYQENLLYIEDMPIYVPYLTRAGEQEGLTLANLFMTDHVVFSSGGWSSRYGDKLSSMLHVRYKDVVNFEGIVSGGLLGGSVFAGGGSKNKRIRVLLGARYKDTGSLLRGLELQGEYLPRFFDIQAMVRMRVGHGRRKELMFFGAYAQNRYRLRPTSRMSSFGTLTDPIHLSVAFEGQELLLHDTAYGGIKWEQRVGDRWRFQALSSGARSLEREYFEILSAYRLCETLQGGFDACEREAGTLLNSDYGRNFLSNYFLYSEASLQWDINAQHRLIWGSFLQFDDVGVRLDEHNFFVEEDFVRDEYAVQTDERMRRYLLGGYAQHDFFSRLSRYSLVSGFRLSYSTLSQEVLLSPRVQFSFTPVAEGPWVWKASTGLYVQYPFYHEMRTMEGTLQRDLLAQRAWHILAGTEYGFFLYGRRFRLFVDVYYKYLARTVPYEQQNIRIRYNPSRVGSGYSYGLDMRFYGFFVPAHESWLSLSFLRTQEDIKKDERGYIRRATDQFITCSLFFRDYLPGFPSWQVYTKFVFGTGVPFNPRGRYYLRNTFQGESYYQLDIGFSKVFDFTSRRFLYAKKLTITLEVLNLLGSSQNISYSWIPLPSEQGSDAIFAVPNDFSVRFINLKALLLF